MKTVSVDELKRHLASILRELKRNETVLVTRHKKPIARLSGTTITQVHRGSLYGVGKLEPALTEGTKGRYLEVVMEDRRSGPER